MSDALVVRGLTVGYAGVPAVRDLDLTLAPGEVLTLIVGAVAPMAGSVVSFATDMTGMRVDQIARLGVALVPDHRGIFSDLTVGEHLRLARSPDGDVSREAALDRFPALRSLQGRRAGLLSGGEQQMLALAKVLVGRPRVLLIDEMSLGLAPLIVQRMLPIIRELAAESGTAVVLVEQHVDLAMAVADRAMVLNRGRVMLAGPAQDLRRDRAAVQAAYFDQN
jgi:branched-chain amino acid transport system ATP-binding protein